MKPAKWNFGNTNTWAIDEDSFDQVGCIHTSQGLEFDYVGVIIGQDLRYDEIKHEIIIDKTKISKDDKSSGIKSCGEGLARELIKNSFSKK